MARKTTKKKSNKRDPERDARNKRIAIVSAVLIGAAGVFIGGSMGIGKLDEQAASFVAPGDLPIVIHWPMTPAGESWMPIQEREQIQLLLNRAVDGGTALSVSPLKEAGLALAGTGWINGLPTVNWNSAGEIEVHADWRIPAAAVRVGNREVIIDWDRHVLPLDYGIGESLQFYFVNADANLPAIGKQWVGMDLHDGIELLRLLQSSNLLEQVEGCDLGQGENSGIIEIITNSNSRIVWGAGPGKERPGEKSAGIKIDRLRALQDSTSRIDGRYNFVDISGADITVDD